MKATDCWGKIILTCVIATATPSVFGADGDGFLYPQDDVAQPSVVYDSNASGCSFGNYGWIVGAEWLSYKTSASNSSYAKRLNSLWLTPEDESRLSPSGDGLRGKIGYRFSNGLDVSWNYTFFDGDDKGARDSQNFTNSVLVVTPSYLDVAVDSVWGESSIDVDVHDLEFGRWLKYDSFSFRPFGSLRCVTIDQNFESGYAYADNRGLIVENKIKDACKTEGYGVRVGGEGVYDLFGGFALVGRGAISCLSGSQKSVAYEEDGVQGAVLNYACKTSETLFGFDAMAGASWSYGGLEIKGGYEWSTWNDASSISGVKSDVSFGGFVAGASWNRRF